MDRDRQHQVQVVAIPCKHRIGFDAHGDVEISGIAARTAGVPEAPNHELRAVGDPRGNVHTEGIGPQLAL